MARTAPANATNFNPAETVRCYADEPIKAGSIVVTVGTHATCSLVALADATIRDRNRGRLLVALHDAEPNGLPMTCVPWLLLESGAPENAEPGERLYLDTDGGFSITVPKGPRAKRAAGHVLRNGGVLLAPNCEGV